MVVQGRGEAHGEVRGDKWRDPPGVRRATGEGRPSTTSPALPSLSFLRGVEEALCRVFSGLERAEEEEDDDDEEEEEDVVEDKEVVEEDSVQVGQGAGGSSVAKET